VQVQQTPDILFFRRDEMEVFRARDTVHWGSKVAALCDEMSYTLVQHCPVFGRSY
jgi:hypothetical protein